MFSIGDIVQVVGYQPDDDSSELKINLSNFYQDDIKDNYVTRIGEIIEYDSDGIYVWYVEFLDEVEDCYTSSAHFSNNELIKIKD